jgi:uncharacterized damage-inducible protein DinB
MEMEREIKHLVKMLQHTYEKNAWHGPAVKEVLENVSDADAQKRLPNSHTIIELVAHMAAWRVFVVKKLQGNTEYKVTDEMNFPNPNDWSKVVEELDASQARLLEALKGFDSSKLYDPVPHGSYNYNFYTLLHGIIHHDLYHTGQIALIKKQTI